MTKWQAEAVAPQARQPLFRVSNHHCASCGPPPEINGDSGGYYGYFENPHGEQAIFHYNYKTRKATLRIGDAEWPHVYEVVDAAVPGVILNEPEALWIIACWMASVKIDSEAKAHKRRVARARLREKKSTAKKRVTL